MNMILNASNAIRFAPRIASNACEIRVELRSRARIEVWAALLRAKNHMNDDKT
jgi:hypothetical protein